MTEIKPKACPICGVPNNYVYKLEGKGKETTVWYRCQNGTIFQDKLPAYIKEDKRIPLADIFDNPKIDPASGLDLSQIHEIRTYINLIEESTYGRKCLDVGFTKEPYVLKYLKERGWHVWGIDNTEFDAGGNLYKGDFLSYNFDIPKEKKEKIKKEFGDIEPFKRDFDLIVMNHYLEKSPDPKEVIKKAYELLSDTGVLYLGVPDIEFIHKRGVGAWPYWDKNNYVLWSKRAIVKELEETGFEVIVCKRNFSTRYNHWDDIQLVCQKNYY